MDMDKCKWLIQRHNQDIHGSHTQEYYVQTTSHLSQFLAIFRQEMKKRKKVLFFCWVQLLLLYFVNVIWSSFCFFCTELEF